MLDLEFQYVRAIQVRINQRPYWARVTFVCIFTHVPERTSFAD
jgi:hypothetical protein